MHSSSVIHNDATTLDLCSVSGLQLSLLGLLGSWLIERVCIDIVVAEEGRKFCKVGDLS